MTFIELLASYLAWRKSLFMSRATIKKDKMVITLFVNYLATFLRVTSVNQLQQDHLHKWHKSLVARTSRRDGLPIKPRTINTYNECLKSYLRYGADQGYLAKGLAEKLVPVKCPQMLPTSVLTHQQMQKMLATMPIADGLGIRDRTMLEILYSSGIRVSELLGINVDDIDMTHKTLLVTGKGDKQRVVPFGKTARQFLENYIKAIRPYFMVNNQEKALFISKLGRRLGYRGFLDRVHDYADLAGLEENVTPHTFRRSCTTELIKSGANMYHVKELLGHESLDTLKKYTKLTIVDLKKTHAKCHPREKDSRPKF